MNIGEDDSYLVIFSVLVEWSEFIVCEGDFTINSVLWLQVLSWNPIVL